MSRLPYEIKTIVNYLRRSRQDEERERRTGEDTLAEQKTLMDRVLQEYQVPYEQRFEIGSGDKIETRPVFKEVLKELRAGMWSAIAVKEISRLGRGSYTDMGHIYDVLTQHRIYIITPYKIYDPKNQADLRQIRFELFLSREEFETTRERLMGARYNYSLQGKWMAGSVPYGYRFNEQTQRLEVESQEAEVVRLIFHLYGREGLGYHAIASELKRLGIRTATGKQKWQPEVIHRMLKKPVYKGQLNFRMTEKINGKVTARPKEDWIVVEGAHEAIIGEAVWEACQKKLSSTPQKQPINRNFTPCELASLVTCGNCSKKMVRQYSKQHYKQKSGKISVYEKEFLRCSCGVYVKYRDVEAQLVDLMRHMLLEEAQLSVALRSEKERDQENLDYAKFAEQVKYQLDTACRRLDRAYELVIDGTFEKEEFEERKVKLNKEIEELQEQLTCLEAKRATDKKDCLDLEHVKPDGNSVWHVYNKMRSTARKNVLLRALFGQIELKVLEKGRGQRPSVFHLHCTLRVSLLAGTVHHR